MRPSLLKLFMAICTVGLITACGGRSSSQSGATGTSSQLPNITGTWVLLKEQGEPTRFYDVAALQLFQDGTYQQATYSNNTEGGSYRFVDNYHLQIEVGKDITVYTIKVNQPFMKLNLGNGYQVDLVRALRKDERVVNRGKNIGDTLIGAWIGGTYNQGKGDSYLLDLDSRKVGTLAFTQDGKYFMLGTQNGEKRSFSGTWKLVDDTYPEKIAKYTEGYGGHVRMMSESGKAEVVAIAYDPSDGRIEVMGEKEGSIAMARIQES